jgi:hypothetical protein
MNFANIDFSAESDVAWGSVRPGFVGAYVRDLLAGKECRQRLTYRAQVG